MLTKGKAMSRKQMAHEAFTNLLKAENPSPQQVIAFFNEFYPEVRDALKVTTHHNSIGSDMWFRNENLDDEPDLIEFLDSIEYDMFFKGGKDRAGNNIIFLRRGTKAIAAIKSGKAAHANALEILRARAKLNAGGGA